MLSEIFRYLFFIFLVLIHLVGCCDNELKDHHSPDSSQIENTSSIDRSTINWLIVKVLESNDAIHSNSETFSSSKSIGGINFYASLENSQIISLQINDEEVLKMNAIELHKSFNSKINNQNFSDQAIWEYTTSISDKNAYVRIGSIQVSDTGDKCLKVSFLITVLDDVK